MSRWWEGERLTAAGDVGIPGGSPRRARTDRVRPAGSVPVQYLDDYRTGRRHSHGDSGVPYQHNESVTIVGCTMEEVERSPCTSPTN